MITSVTIDTMFYLVLIKKVSFFLGDTVNKISLVNSKVKYVLHFASITNAEKSFEIKEK